VNTYTSNSCNEEYLSLGFQSIDKVDKQEIYTTCLKYIDELPYFMDIKKETYTLLNLDKAKNVLDIGCGIGKDVYRIAKILPEDSTVTGLDASSYMVKNAQTNIPSELQDKVFFYIADAKALPFSENTFDRCRIDRVLQHISDPLQVIRESYRILKPGGIIVIYDNDWNSFSLSLNEKHINRTICNYWADSFVNGQIAFDLKGYLYTEGFKKVIYIPKTLLLDDFEIADQIYNLRKTMQYVEYQGLLSKKEVDYALAEFMRQTREKSFSCALTSYIIVAQK